MPVASLYYSGAVELVAAGFQSISESIAKSTATCTAIIHNLVRF